MILALVTLALALAATSAALGASWIRMRTAEAHELAAGRELNDLATWADDARAAVHLEHGERLDDLIAAYRIPTIRHSKETR